MDFIFFDSSAPSCGRMIDYCFKNSTSDGPQFCIEKAMLIPSSFVGLILGIVFAIICLRWKTQTTRMFYVIAFFIYSGMMLVAAGLHCFVHDEGIVPTYMEILRIVLILLDFTLSTNIALTFAFAGLTDVGVWKWSVKEFKIITIVLWCLVFVAWFISLVSGLYLFNILYVYLVAVCYIIWTVTQVMLYAHNPTLLTKKGKKIKTSTIFLIVGMVFLVIGLVFIMPAIGNYYCGLVGQKISSWVSPMVVWYYSYDISILFIGLFLVFTRKTRAECSKYFLSEV